MGIVQFASMLLPSAISLQMEVCAYMILNCKNMLKWKKTVTQEFWVQELQVKPPHGRFLQREHQGQTKDMLSKKERCCC